MNSFELNKILGAILGTCLVILALNIGAGALFAPGKPAKPGYEIAVKTEGGGEKKEAEKVAPLPVRLAKASVDKGKSIAGQCKACHKLEKDAGNLVGPPLWGVVDRTRAGHPGFNYTSAMKAKGGKWTFDELDKFLTDPRGYISGTAMTFSGIENPQQRADVIAFLDSLADNPVPLPKPEAQNTPPAAPAEAPKAGAAPAPAPQPK